MFSFQNKIPEFYMKESRDFQLLPRLNDILFLGIHQDIDTINELNNPKKCKNAYLNYLAEKVGFYTDEYIPDIVLSNIISAFKTAVKNKGTLKGIIQAVVAILKAENTIEPPKIVYIKGKNEVSDYWEQYTINIYTPVKILNEIALKEFLKYIIPAGHNFNIYVYNDAGLNKETVRIDAYDNLYYVKDKNVGIGIVRKEWKEYNLGLATKNDEYSDVLNRLLGTADIGVVVDINDIYEDKENPSSPEVNSKVTTALNDEE